MSRGRSGLLERTLWTPEQLATDLLRSKEIFRRERLEEPLEAYLEAFEEARDTIENLLEGTVDLSLLKDQALEILKDPRMIEGFRYLAGPPISLDDLKTLVDTDSLAPASLEQHPDLVERLVQTIMAGLDRRRFPWVPEQRDPTSAEREAAIIASAALIATQRVATSRRTAGKKAQEDLVRLALLDYGLEEIIIPGGAIQTLNQAPKPSQFCREVVLGERKADLIVGLWDTRIMPIECKVSNSSTNSVKRLNNDAAVKAEVWIKDFGSLNVVPAAVLSGVYKRHNLENAQRRGVTLYWAHRLEDMTLWMERVRNSLRSSH